MNGANRDSVRSYEFSCVAIVEGRIAIDDLSPRSDDLSPGFDDLTIFRLDLTICRPDPKICLPNPTMCSPDPTICRPELTIFRLDLTICRPDLMSCPGSDDLALHSGILVWSDDLTRSLMQLSAGALYIEKGQMCDLIISNVRRL